MGMGRICPFRIFGKIRLDGGESETGAVAEYRHLHLRVHRQALIGPHLWAMLPSSGSHGVGVCGGCSLERRPESK